MGRWLAGLICLMGAAPFAAAAPGQQDRAPTLDEALSAVAAAYQSGETHERVQISVDQGERRVARERYTVRLVPGGADPHERALMVDLRAVTLVASDGELRAFRGNQPDACARWTFDGPVAPDVLAGRTPPLALPQADFAWRHSGDWKRGVDVLPFAPRLRFFDVRETPTGKPMLEFRGTSDLGEATLLVDRASARLVELRAQADGAGGLMTITMRFSRTADLPRDEWVPDLSRVRVVTSLDELLVQGGDEGAKIGSIRVIESGGVESTLAEAAGACDLVLAVRMGPDEDLDAQRAVLKAGLDAMRLAVAESRGSVAVLGVPGAEAGPVDAVVWMHGEVSRLWPDGRPLPTVLWSVSGDVLDDAASSSEAACIIIGRGGRPHRVVAWVGDATAFAAALEEALKPD